MRTLFIATSIVIASLSLAACEEEPASLLPAKDAGTDAGSSSDAGQKDAGSDAGTGGGMDAGRDSGLDSGTDAGTADAGDSDAAL